MNTRRAVVLLSGGLDSATTLAIARAEGYECFALSVAYGQRHSSELSAASRIAVTLGAKEHRVMRVDLANIGGSALTDAALDIPETPSDGIPITYVPARNTIMLSLALAWAEVLEAEAIFIGVNARDYSVAGTTKVWIRDQSGPRLMAIENVCALPENHYETLAVDLGSYKLRWRRVLGRFKHQVSGKRCFRIGLERGQTIEVSEDHSLFTINETGQITPIRGSEIVIGTPIVVPFDLKGISDAWSADLPLMAIDKPTAHSIRGRRSSVREESGFLTNRLRRCRFPTQLPVTDEFLRVVGLWLAEGGKEPDSPSSTLSFSIGALDGAVELLRSYFRGFDVNVHKSPANDFDYRVESSVAVEVFRRLDLLATAKSGRKRFPAWFWRLSQRQRRIVVAGFWDGDGSHVWKGEASVSQKSHELIRDLYHCLLLDGIFATVKPGPHSQLRLALTRGVDLARFAELYPLSHVSKRGSIKEAGSRTGRDKTTGLWKFDEIWNEVAATRLAPGRKTRIYNAGGKYDASVRAQRNVFAEIPSLTELVESPLAFLRVTSIEPVSYEFMYDLSVEHDENFIANGFMAHNSGYPDCRPEFIRAFNALSALATKTGVENRPTRIETPLIDLSKADIISWGTKLGVDYSATISCYQAAEDGSACGRCDSCRLRRDGFVAAGIADPTQYK